MSKSSGNSPPPSNERNEGKMSTKDLAGPGKDIAPVLNGWDYEPGTINVRRIVGSDGRAKLQMRLDLGLLQMEVTGRPDGATPHGCESLLEYFERMLTDHRAQSGSEEGFNLTRSQCSSLREEAEMYYRRYLSLFVLEDYSGVVRDTARNLRVLDLCGQFAMDEHDRVVLEQFRPYILMMNARAAAHQLLRDHKPGEAYRRVRSTLAEIKDFFERFGQTAAFKHSSEVKVLKRLAREIKPRVPVDPLKALRGQLERAIAAERYEEAARLRDEIAELTRARGV